MAIENPYQSPRMRSEESFLRFKARRLLDRFHRNVNMALYLRDQWRRHLLFSLLYGLLVLASYVIGNIPLAIALLAFWGGRFLRDLQWYRALSREWESTKELLDWEKIQKLADDVEI